MKISCDTCVVRNRAICSVLPDTELLELNRIGRRRHVRRGEALSLDGYEELLCANVLTGVVKLSLQTRDGRQQIVSVAYPSDFIGYPFTQDTGKHGEDIYTVEALTDAEVCIYTREAFAEFAETNSRLKQELLRRTTTELERARRWMLLLGRKSARERVASLLIEISNRRANLGCTALGASPMHFTLLLSRQQMADILGLTVETVSRQLGQLVNDGLIAFPSVREVEILDWPGLQQAADAE